ncbi:GNAT family protein [uncultured Pseudokineococcus sp.]|uniref:GNAT family N-acetyltransferase n=1 Tax=uncultured Pseudokineococcus sp. TaxID=1642928 RepID=UPI00261920CD|nr:GNAT family protein [uncultured Pseudokineococcus sp.]
MSPAPLDMPRLVHPPVLLRAFTAADAPLVVEASRDPYILATTTVPRVPSPDAVKAFLERQHERARSGTGWSLAVCGARTGAGRGQIGLWPLGQGRASVGYWVTPSSRRRGVATAALECLSRWALDNLGLARLELYVEPWNTGSLRAAVTAGYEREGLMRSFREVDGGRRDMLLLARLRAPGVPAG